MGWLCEICMIEHDTAACPVMRRLGEIAELRKRLVISERERERVETSLAACMASLAEAGARTSIASRGDADTAPYSCPLCGGACTGNVGERLYRLDARFRRERAERAEKAELELEAAARAACARSHMRPVSDT